MLEDVFFEGQNDSYEHLMCNAQVCACCCCVGWKMSCTTKIPSNYIVVIVQIVLIAIIVIVMIVLVRLI